MEVSLKEEDIRSKENLDYRWSLYKQDQERLLQKKASFIEVNCPACHKNICTLFYERSGFTFKKCKACKTVYVSPRPSQELLFEHYQNSKAEKYFNEIIYPKTEKGRVKHLIQPRANRIIDFCIKHNVNFDTIVDVGSGVGTFPEIIQQSGRFKNVYAIEPDPSPAQICRNKGLMVFEDFIEKILKVDFANVVTSFESIEHVFSPKHYILNVNYMLKAGGLFIITTPNVMGFDLLTLKDKSDNTTAPDHLNYFHTESLSLLLESCGFSTLETLTPGKLDVELVRDKVLNGKFSLENQPFLQRILIDEYESLGQSFQKWISENGLSSHLWVVAKKNEITRKK